MRGGELYIPPDPNEGRPKRDSSWRTWLIPAICLVIAAGLITRAIQKRSRVREATITASPTSGSSNSKLSHSQRSGSTTSPHRDADSGTSLPQHFPSATESQPLQPDAWVEFRSAIRSCFPNEAQDADRAGGLPPQLSSAALEAVFGPLRKKESLTHIEHLKFANGGERRLRVSLEAQADDGVRPILRVYDVDPEGLPIPLKIPDSHTRSPSDVLLATYRQSAEVSYKQIEWGVAYASGAVGQLIETNGTVSGVQVRLRGRLLHCLSSSQCECL